MLFFFIDHVLGVRLKISSLEDLNEEQIEEQILKPVSKSVMLVWSKALMCIGWHLCCSCDFRVHCDVVLPTYTAPWFVMYSQFGDLLSQHGIDVSGLRLRRIYKTEP